MAKEKQANLTRRPTRHDVAQKAGVSPTTVTFVLTGRDVKLAESTRERVRRAADELGYQPNALAAALSTGRTGLVSFWLETLSNAYSASVGHHLAAQAARAGYQVMVNLYGSPGAPTISGLASAFPADGVLVVGGAAIALPIQRAHPALPLVSLGVMDETVPGVDTVMIDLTPGAVEAVMHLVDQGRRRVAFLRTDHVMDQAGKRAAAYHSVIESAGRKPETILAHSQTRPSARIAVTEYVERHGCPDGLFCLNDEMALGAYRAFCDLNIRVPEDVALVGCDGIEDAEYGACPLSTIIQPFALMCERGWQLLERRMQTPGAPPEQIVLPAHLVARQSSRP